MAVAKILVVEDEQDSAQALSEVLGSKFDVEVAWNGNEALDRLERKPFDCVLMDIQMPGRDGFEATRAIRKLSSRFHHNRGIPIVAMSALPLENLADVDAVGFNGFVPKPINVQTLFKAIGIAAPIL